jgi:hypothetical protein
MQGIFAEEAAAVPFVLWASLFTGLKDGITLPNVIVVFVVLPDADVIFLCDPK